MLFAHPHLFLPGSPVQGYSAELSFWLMPLFTSLTPEPTALGMGGVLEWGLEGGRGETEVAQPVLSWGDRISRD